MRRVLVTIGAAAVLLGAGAAVRYATAQGDTPVAPPGAPSVTIHDTATPAPPPAAFAVLADGTVLYADGAGRIFRLRPGPESVTLAAVYDLRYDRVRHAREPDRRAPHGWYLDDIGASTLDTLARAKEGFVIETRRGAVDPEANARAESWAKQVLASGDASFLIEQLRDKRYGTRRAVAFILGEAGYPEARGMLEEILDEKLGDGSERAKRILEKLPQK
jgi:hypothetical protein